MPHCQIFTLLVLGDAALSVPSFIGSTVISWCILVNSTRPLFFGDAAPSVLFDRVKGHILMEFYCALCKPHFLTDLFQSFSTDVHHSRIYAPIVFGNAALSVPSFIGSKVI